MYYDGNGYAHQPEEWTNVRTAWNATQGAGYEFWGTTGETGANLTATQGWTDLNNNNPGYVLNELVCFGC